MRVRFGFGATAASLALFLDETSVAFTTRASTSTTRIRTTPFQERAIIGLGLATGNENAAELAPSPLPQEPTIALATAAPGVADTVPFPFSRAGKISSIVVGGMVAPLIQSIITKGIPTTDWEEFWGRTNAQNNNNNNNNARIVIFLPMGKKKVLF